MATTTVRIPDDLYDKIKKLAQIEGENVSTYMRNILIEHVQDELDYQDAVEILKKNDERISRKDVIKEVFSD